MKFFALLLFLCACDVPQDNWRGGAINPVCIILCDAKFSNADASDGASLTASNTQTSSTQTGDKNVSP